jgi:hypothetical protein
VLPLYPLLAMVAGYGALRLWNAGGRIAPLAAAGSLLWLAASSAWAHPDYLAYFNSFVSHPERVEVDSDLDWGQDLARLSVWLRDHGVREVSISYFGSADLNQAGLPRFRELLPFQPATGWVAISAYNRTFPSPFQIRHFRNVPPYFSVSYPFDPRKVGPGPFAWLSAYRPVTRVGHSIFMYYIGETTP